MARGVMRQGSERRAVKADSVQRIHEEPRSHGASLA
jgi:hypothetical protein